MQTQKRIEEKLSHLASMYERIVSCEIVLNKEKNDEQKIFVLTQTAEPEENFGCCRKNRGFRNSP
jgi:hypothetical protein